MRVITGHGHGLVQQARRLLRRPAASSWSARRASAVTSASRTATLLAQRVVGGQRGHQPLRRAQPAAGQFLLDLLAHRPDGVPGEHGCRDQPGLLLVQAEFTRLGGNGPLRETALGKIPQPFGDLRQQQRVQLGRVAGGPARDGEGVLARGLGRIRVRPHVNPAARIADRLSSSRCPSVEPEPGQHPETGEQRILEHSLRGKPQAERLDVLDEVGELRCGAAGSSGNSSTTRTPAFRSAARTSASVTVPPSAPRSRATVTGPT